MIQLPNISAGVVVYPVFLMFSGSWWIASLAVGVSLIATRIANDWRISIFGPVVAIGVISAAILVWEQLFNLSVPGAVLVVTAVFGVWVGLAMCWGWHPNASTPDGVGLLTLVAVGLTVHALTRDWSQTNTLAMMQSMGEDNAYFLDIVATASQTGAIDSRISGLSGGTVVFGTSLFAAGLRRLSFDNQWQSALGVAETLQRLYYGLIYFAILTSGAIVTVMRSFKNVILDITALFLTSGIVIAFSSGLMRGGHFSSLVAAVFIMCLLLATMSMELLTKPTIVRLILLSSVIMLWQTWAPLILVVVGTLIWLLLYGLRSSVLASAKASCSRVIGASSISVVMVLYIWRSGIWQGLWDEFAELMIQSGGEARVIGWFSVLVQLVALLSISSSQNPLNLLRTAILSSLCLSASLLMVMGWLLPPYEPQYGPNKYLYLATFAVTPFAIGWFRSKIESQSTLVVATLMFVVIGGIMQAAVSPLSELALRIGKTSGAEWQPGAIVALNSFPQRKVLCMETREDGDQEYEAYRCSRLLNGMQGQFSDNQYYRWNLCLVSSRQVASLTDSDWESMTLLISDGNRLSTTDGCHARGWVGDGLPLDDEFLLGWASGIRWDLVKIVSYSGEIVDADFEYLRGYSQYSDADINGLVQRYIG